MSNVPVTQLQLGGEALVPPPLQVIQLVADPVQVRHL